MATPRLILGAGIFAGDKGFKSVDDVKPWFDALLESKNLVGEIDTAYLYLESEEWLGQLKFGSEFAIDTKLPGQNKPDQPATKDAVISQTKESMSKLCVDQLDILYMHSPDTRVPFEETLSGIDILYREGKFKRFGLSNYTPEQVEEVLRVCNKRGFVLPSVYQGGYSAIARLAEDRLLPLLRKHNISFYAYSPISGGFLAKTTQQFRDDSLVGRWDKKSYLGTVYHNLYNKPDTLEALDKWNEIAEAEGIPAAEMAYRWVVHNSALNGSLGDGVVVGASTIEQWKSNLAAIRKGPLSTYTANKIDALWGPLRADAVLGVAWMPPSRLAQAGKAASS